MYVYIICPGGGGGSCHMLTTSFSVVTPFCQNDIGSTLKWAFFQNCATISVCSRQL